ncbi:hypothetical protein [Bradyrhizobium sp. USDA 313]
MEPLDRPDGLESTGEFLFKDIVLLGVCVVLLLASRRRCWRTVY